jgi:hypothetical protein
VPAGSCGVDEQRSEPLHPSIDRDVSQVSFIQHEVICANAMSIATFRGQRTPAALDCCAPSGMQTGTHVVPNGRVSGGDGCACLRSVGRGGPLPR